MLPPKKTTLKGTSSGRCGPCPAPGCLGVLAAPRLPCLLPAKGSGWRWGGWKGVGLMEGASGQTETGRQEKCRHLPPKRGKPSGFRTSQAESIRRPPPCHRLQTKKCSSHLALPQGFSPGSGQRDEPKFNPSCDRPGWARHGGAPFPGVGEAAEGLWGDAEEECGWRRVCPGFS